MNFSFINNADPNLSTYKDSESKFKAMNVVYTDYNDIYDHTAQLFLDANCTVPLTLTKMAEMLQSGLPIAASVNHQLCFATGTYVHTAGEDYDEWPDVIGLVFAKTTFSIPTESGVEPELQLMAFIGTVDFTEETANNNLQYGTRPGDGHEEGYIGFGCSGFTLAFGLNTATQKVIPNPFAEN